MEMKKIERCKVVISKSKKWLSRQPYIVSGDIVPLLQRWAVSKNFVLPAEGFFAQLRADFSQYMRQIFPEFEFVHEDELAMGINNIVAESGLHPISLDRVYYPTAPSLDIARLVDKDGNDKGLGRRPGAPSIAQQFRSLDQLTNKNIVLVDDVIFTGDLLEKIANLLFKKDFRVSLICAGIGVGEGIEKLVNAGYNVRCVRTYWAVIDEVCERDFYPGVPFSGRVLVGEENIGVPYLLPFGNPGKWASIPQEWQVPFSRFCLHQTIRLFEEIEKCSKRVVTCAELDRMVVTLPQDRTRFVDALSLVLQTL